MIETTSLTCATVLAMNGFDYELRTNGRGAVWVFSPEDGDEKLLMKLFNEINTGSSLVEPREFMGKVKALRVELYKYLEQNGLSTRHQHA